MVVIGGGIAGMAAARRLQDAGAGVVLLEKSARLGGLVETTVDDGFVVEGGPDSFVTGKGAVTELADDLGVGHEVISANPESQGSQVWWDGRLHPLPGGLLLMVPTRLRPFLKSPLLSWRGKAGAFKDLVLPRSGVSGDESLGSFVRRRLGDEILERIAEPLIAGIHAAEPETMSLRASFPRFLDMEARDRSLILAARRVDKAQASSPQSHFSSFQPGMSQLTDALTDAIDGVEVRTGVEAIGLETDTNGYHISTRDGRDVSTSAVILAVPAPVATHLLSSVSPEASSLLSTIGQVSNQAVTLAYQSEQLPELAGSGFVVPSVQPSPIRGVSYLSRKWAGRVPDDGFSLLRVFLKASREGDPVELARAGLRTMVGVRSNPVRSWVRTHTHGLHRYTLGHLERVDRAESSLRQLSGVVLAGAGFHGVGLNECIRSGHAAAGRVLGSLGSTIDSH